MVTRVPLMDHIISEIARHDHQCDTWAIAMEIPNTVLFRQYGMWWHLRSLIPYIDTYISNYVAIIIIIILPAVANHVYACYSDYATNDKSFIIAGTMHAILPYVSLCTICH